jgi:hypothetical protein
VEAQTSVTPPEQGQLVEVRQRRYVVTEVIPGRLVPETGRQALEGDQHLVGLSSIEDDALGEELRVIP